MTNYYQLNKPYSITIQPCDKYQFHGHPLRFKKFYDLYYTLFQNFKGEYDLFIELSEPHQQLAHQSAGSRLHIHGTIQFRKTKHLGNFLMYFQHKLLKYGNLDIDTIKDLAVWYKYCTKQHILSKSHLCNSIGGLALANASDS